VGVKLSKITALQSDLSLALAAHPIRIEAPIPGKSLVGVEVPNKKFALVGMRNMLDSDDFQKSSYVLPIALGRDVAGFPVFANLARMPHLLVAGATGTGKSVCINTIILSLLYRHSPNILKFIFIDPKRVELTVYNGIPHLITPTIVEPKKAVNALKWAVREMEKRYEMLATGGSRDIFSYNAKQASKKDGEIMPFIVVVIDELADLMMSYGRDIEATVVRLAQMARAVGIHLIVSTQRPSVEVITGLIKANITSRIAFQVASGIDSRTILDATGAEDLLGKGDMLFQAGDVSKPKRIQGTFVTEKEVKDVAKFIKMQSEQMEEEGATEGASTGTLSIEPDAVVADVRHGSGDEDGGDDMYHEAKEVVIQAGKASASLLQRRLRVGYARAARLLDLLEESGIIGPGEGAKPREVFRARTASISSGPEMPEGVRPMRDDGTVAQEAPSEEI
jgi:S-DNA-T family DNA segregation ATPase FtsK/SpoIIIE